MALAQMNTAKPVEVYEEGTYLSRLRAVVIEHKSADNYNSEPYDQLAWDWDMKLPGRQAPVKYRTWTSLSLHEKSHLPGLLKALDVPTDDLLGVDDATGEAVYKDGTRISLLGRIALLVVQIKMKQDGKTPKNETKIYMKRPAGGTPVAAQAAPPTAPVPDAAAAIAAAAAAAQAPVVSQPVAAPAPVVATPAPAPAAPSVPFDPDFDVSEEPNDTIPF